MLFIWLPRYSDPRTFLIETQFSATSIGSTTLAYDQDGNLVGDGTWTNTWDYKDELLSSAKTGTTVVYAYDHAGNRVSQNDGTTTHLTPNAYYGVTGSKIDRNVLFPGLGSVATDTWNGTVASIIYHHTDHLGGTHVETDPTGTTVEYELYTPYGGTLVDHKTGTYEDKYKYTGKEKDTATGWYYYGARYYNAADGVFMSEDPVFLAVGTKNYAQEQKLAMLDPQLGNSYAYSRDNPITLLDPTGNFSVWSMLSSIIRAPFNFVRNPSVQTGFFIGASIIGDVVSAAAMGPEVLPGEIAGEAAVVESRLGMMGEETSALGPKLESVEVRSFGKTLYNGPRDLTEPLKQIEEGTLKDRGFYKNNEAQLPAQSENYYREFELKTPEKTGSGAGPERMIQGKQGETYYTPDHYQSFNKIR